MSARILAAALALALLPLACLRPAWVRGRSMEPALGDGALCFALRAWCAGAPAPGQVWLVRSPAGPAVKRLVALPGDRVEFRAGGLWINGRPRPEPYPARNEAEAGGPWAAGPGYFLLGDNRPGSRDSRSWGSLPAAALQGRVWFVALPGAPAHPLS